MGVSDFVEVTFTEMLAGGSMHDTLGRGSDMFGVLRTWLSVPENDLFVWCCGGLAGDELEEEEQEEEDEDDF